jgi:hypothetical protein
MHTYSPYRLAAPKPRALGLAIALAFCAVPGVSTAGDASLNITSFSVSAADGTFAWTTDMYQSLTMDALQAGGLMGMGHDSYSANDWNLGLNRLAQTANAKATGNTVQFTDVTTQLMTAGFNLSGQATASFLPLPTLPNSANASALQAGSFVLLDDTGALTGGTITFDLYYDMMVSTPGSSPSTYSQTQLDLLLSSDATVGDTSFADGLLSSDFAGGIGSITSGHYSFTYTLAAGEAAYYTLSGSAIAVAAAIPEPETYALMLLGLAGVGAVARRRRAQAGAGSAAA